MIYSALMRLRFATAAEPHVLGANYARGCKKLVAAGQRVSG